MEKVTDEKFLIEFLSKYEDMTDPTVRKRMRDFKKSIYAASFGHTNPAYYMAPRQELNVPEEVFFIYEMIYLYLTENNYLSIEKCHRKDESTGGEAPTDSGVLAEALKSTFHWDIPDTFVPFICACIIATSTTPATRTGITASAFKDSFIENLKKGIKIWNDNYIPLLEDEVLKQYDSLANYDLGIKYACLSEEMIDKYARKGDDTFQSDSFTLRNSVQPITLMMLECSPEYSSVRQSLTALLEKNTFCIESYLSENTRDLNVLYPRDIFMPVEIQMKIADPSINMLISQVAKLMDYIELYLQDNHIESSQYKVSVKDFNSFKEACDQQLSSIENVCTEATDLYAYNLKSECTFLINSYGWQKTGDIFFQNNISKFGDITRSYATKIISEFEEFLKNVKYDSENAVNLNYYSKKKDVDFKDSVRYIESLYVHYKEDLSKEFGKLEPAVRGKDWGYIAQISYPPMDGNIRNAVIRIISTLS